MIQYQSLFWLFVTLILKYKMSEYQSRGLKCLPVCIRYLLQRLNSHLRQVNCYLYLSKELNLTLQLNI